jgi:hypothetical protein
MNQLVPIIGDRTHALVAAEANAPPIASLNSSPPISATRTRAAPMRAPPVEFFDWLHAKGVTRLTAIESVHVAAYIHADREAKAAACSNAITINRASFPVIAPRRLPAPRAPSL